MAFAPASQFPGAAPFIHLVIYSQSGPPTIVAVKRMISARHRDVLMEFSDFQQQIHDGLIAERLMAMLAGFFGLLAALLATIGLYGVISYIVLMRRNEIGIRMALGASRNGVLRNILRDTVMLLAIGMSVGTGLALIVTRSAATLLYGLQPNDALTFAAAGAVLVAAALLASYVPALRASRLDPMVALRYE
jgi:ABC-type antimicrobial peptide transport system permease subunit